MNKQLSNTQKRRRYYIRKKLKQLVRHYSLPEWTYSKASFITLITDALLSNAAISLTYCKGDNRQRPIHIEDLAVILFAIDHAACSTRFPYSLSYYLMDKASRYLLNRRCPKDKAARIRVILIALGLIEKVGGHSKGRHGTCFRLTQKAMGLPSTTDVARVARMTPDRP